ncbi:MAG: polyphenol oxidase family protein [Myxococcota bacterium]
MPHNYLHHYGDIPSRYNVVFYAGDADLSSGLLPKAIRHLGAPAYLKQTHSSIVKSVSAAGAQGEGDALVTSQNNIALCIQTADCVPVLLWKGESVAAIHAGWRGLQQRIISRCIEELGEPEGALIGPCISTAHYETGLPVIEALVRNGFPEEVIRVEGTNKPHCDLRAAAEYEVNTMGCQQVFHHGVCTYSNLALPSYRRSGKGAGRLLSIITIRN